MSDIIIGIIKRFSWILVVLILAFGWFSPLLMILTFICMIGPIAFSFKYGRAWCGNFCPRGSFSNYILSIISYKKDIPKFLKSNIFRILVFICLMSYFAFNMYHTHGSLIRMGRVFLRMMLLTTVIQICFGILIHPNTWCTFCPMGTVAYYIAKLKGNCEVNIKFSKECISCQKCKANCPIQIDIPKWYLSGEISDKNCMKCRRCIEACPKKALVWDEEISSSK